MSEDVVTYIRHLHCRTCSSTWREAQGGRASWAGRGTLTINFVDLDGRASFYPAKVIIAVHAVVLNNEVCVYVGM